MKYNLFCKKKLLSKHKYRQRIETTQRIQNHFFILCVVSIRWELFRCFLFVAVLFNIAASVAQESKLIRQTQEAADRKSQG
ncbi:MAG: hypothetical protein ACREOI_26400, partial [bacterium]